MEVEGYRLLDPTFLSKSLLYSLSLSLVWVSYTVAVIYFCLVGAEFSVLKYDERTGCNSARLERW
jgi:hypothetical protein